MVFMHSAEWAEKTRLGKDDTLPLIVDVTFDVAANDNNTGNIGLVRAAGRGSYIADFGVLDLPWLGELRSRAGLRYSRLYPRGALELGFRKEVRSDSQRGYEIFAGAQTAGDDRRLDILCEVGALKSFRGAKAFYRFLLGMGWQFGGGPSWSEMGSSLGVMQEEMPPRGCGELTVGWRTGLFDNGLEGVAGPTSASRGCRSASGNRKSRDAQNKGSLDLDSTPYASYGIRIPLSKSAQACLSWTILPEHDVIEHAVNLCFPEVAGSATVSVVVDQSLRNPTHVRLRVGGSYTRG